MPSNLTARASISSPARNLISFNDFKYKPGKYRNVNTGNIIVVFSEKGELVKADTRTGFTRTNMFMFEPDTGKVRRVCCGEGPDGDKRWEPYTGTITL